MIDLYIVRLFKGIEHQRSQAGLSIDDLALLLDITRKTYIEWKFGRRIPNSKRETQFIKLGKVLTVALEQSVLPERGLKLRKEVVTLVAQEMEKLS